MKIAILGAMDEEISLLKNSLEDCKTQQYAHLTIYIGKLDKHEVALLKCGIGKVAAAVATTLVISDFSPDIVINTGSAGGFDARLEVGDIVIADKVIHHDVDVTHFGYSPGQCPNMPEYFQAEPDFINLAMESAKRFSNITTVTGKVATGDSFIGTDEAAEKLKSQFTDVAAVEMEGAAIAQTAFLMGIPFLVIRSLSDIAGKSSPVSFEQYLEKAAKHSAELVIDLIKHA